MTALRRWRWSCALQPIASLRDVQEQYQQGEEGHDKVWKNTASVPCASPYRVQFIGKNVLQALCVRPVGPDRETTPVSWFSLLFSERLRNNCSGQRHLKCSPYQKKNCHPYKKRNGTACSVVAEILCSVFTKRNAAFLFPWLKTLGVRQSSGQDTLTLALPEHSAWCHPNMLFSPSWGLTFSKLSLPGTLLHFQQGSDAGPKA